MRNSLPALLQLVFQVLLYSTRTPQNLEGFTAIVGSPTTEVVHSTGNYNSDRSRAA